MTLAQATAAEAAGPRIHAYVMLSLCTGVRLRRAADAVVGVSRDVMTGFSLPPTCPAGRRIRGYFGDPDSRPPRPASVAVWRSVRAREPPRPTPGEPALPPLRVQDYVERFDIEP
jgi:hypothetical protein